MARTPFFQSGYAGSNPAGPNLVFHPEARYLGALTSKYHSFQLRPWKTYKAQTLEPITGFGLPVEISWEPSHGLPRVVPRSSRWIPDLCRVILWSLPRPPHSKTESVYGVSVIAARSMEPSRILFFEEPNLSVRVPELHAMFFRTFFLSPSRLNFFQYLQNLPPLKRDSFWSISFISNLPRSLCSSVAGPSEPWHNHLSPWAGFGVSSLFNSSDSSSTVNLSHSPFFNNLFPLGYAGRLHGVRKTFSTLQPLSHTPSSILPGFSLRRLDSPPAIFSPPRSFEPAVLFYLSFFPRTELSSYTAVEALNVRN